VYRCPSWRLSCEHLAHTVRESGRTFSKPKITSGLRSVGWKHNATADWKSAVRNPKLYKYFMNQKTFAIFDTPFNKKLISELESKNQNLILFPHFTKTASETDSFELSNYDWLIFTDINTVEFFVQSLENRNVNLFELDELRVCAFGEAVSDKLRLRQLHADVIPAKADAQSVISAIKEYEIDFDSQRFLIINAVNSNKNLVDAFASETTSFDVLSVYEYDKVEISAKSKALLKGGAIDEFIFNSPEDVCDFVAIFSETEINVVASDSIIHQNLKEHGLNAKLFQIVN
jgi:uroporphyrinogen-III synthase